MDVFTKPQLNTCECKSNSIIFLIQKLGIRGQYWDTRTKLSVSLFRFGVSITDSLNGG